MVAPSTCRICRVEVTPAKSWAPCTLTPAPPFPSLPCHALPRPTRPLALSGRDLERGIRTLPCSQPTAAAATGAAGSRSSFTTASLPQSQSSLTQNTIPRGLGATRSRQSPSALRLLGVVVRIRQARTMAVTKELLQMDLYALLGIEEKAADKEVKKAYRQKALSCHPDKNPDNPRAAELFHQLSQALEVLTDAAARAAYDKVRKAKKQAAERTQKLDEKRKKVKLDLEARERQAQAQESEEEEESRSTRTLEQEIERLREEGSRQLEEQQRLIREQIRQEHDHRLRGAGPSPHLSPLQGSSTLLRVAMLAAR
ncbi:hypothetical protein H8959_016362 [Pygathrix nigripes]